MNSLFWLIIAIITGIIEVVTLSLVSIWFSIAALVLSILSIYINNTYTQIFIFAMISLILLFLTRNFAKKFLMKRKFESNLIGTKVKVLDKEEDYYLVKFKGVVYKAISNNEIEIGSYVTIKEFIGNKIVLEV